MRSMIDQAAVKRQQMLSRCSEELEQMQRLADARNVDIDGFVESASAKLRQAEHDRETVTRCMADERATSMDLVASVQLDQSFNSLVRQLGKELQVVRDLLS